MRKSRTVIVLLIALVAGGFSGRSWFVGKTREQGISALSPEVTSPRAAAVQATRVASGRALVAPIRAQAAARALALAVTPLQLSADANTLVAEMCDLQLLAHDVDLALNSRQWSALAAVVLRTQAIRQTYEAQIATSKEIAPGEYRVEIPAYAKMGDALREKFNAELRTELGEGTAVEVLGKLGDRLEARFAGFGVSMQTLDITANPGGAPSDVRVTRTVTYWDSTEDSDRLTTRHETHFPAWEDPTGDSWGALLAMVKAS